MGSFERRWRAASRRHWAILVACVALVLLGAWLAIGERPAPSVVVLPAPAAPRPATYSVDETTAVEQAVPVAGDARGSERVEVCGLGWVESRPDGGVDPATLGSMPLLEAALQRQLRALASSADEFERVAALWLESITVENDAARIAELGEKIARAATTTRDPAVYALAFKSCAKTRATSCPLLSATRWAQLDHDNGEPWLFLLHEATVRRDRGQIDDALFHIGSAARVDERFHAVAAALARRVGNSDADLLASHLLAIIAIGGSAAHASPGLQELSTACRDMALVDANRRQRCDAAAAAMTERSDTLVSASIGAAIGRRLGWPERRSEFVVALQTATFESYPTRDGDPQQWSCRRAESILARFARQAAVGEIRFAREWIEAGGTSVERYAAKQAEQRRQRADEAARERSAAVVAVAAADAAASVPGR